MSQEKQFASSFLAIFGGLSAVTVFLVITAINLSGTASAVESEEVLLDNIRPVGQVYVAGESAPEPEPVADAGAAAAPKSGEEIYNGNCMACHGTGAAGAPKLGDAAAWAPRIAKGMDSLVSSAVNGLNAMPPKGLCMTCSDADLQAAIEYMVSQSQ